MVAITRDLVRRSNTSVIAGLTVQRVGCALRTRTSIASKPEAETGGLFVELQPLSSLLPARIPLPGNYLTHAKRQATLPRHQILCFFCPVRQTEPNLRRNRPGTSNHLPVSLIRLVDPAVGWAASSPNLNKL